MRSLGAALADIKISHTLFALPMALTGMVLATGGARPPARHVLLILLCMVTGRTAAMGWNRIADRAIDARNPRTSARAIPAGQVSPRAMAALVVACAVLFLVGAALLNRLTLLLAPVALATFAIYPYTKRFTALCHFVLGLALAAAPVGAWIAIRGDVTAVPLLLGAAVLLWVAGFDILYALQDEAFDRAEALSSVPVALGPGGARGLARALHAGTVVFLVLVGLAAGCGPPFHVGVVAAALMLAASHWLVRARLERLHAAFFTLNSWLSVAVLAGTVLDAAL